MQCDPLVAEGAVAAASPCEVVEQCDITFAMLADPEAALKVGIEGIGSSCPGCLFVWACWLSGSLAC